MLRGKQGVGKTKVGEVIGSLFASHYFLVDNPRYLTGQFNAHMATCLLLQVDEGFWAGDKAAEGQLKGLITAEAQMIESKGIDPIRLRNYVRLMFSSNEGWVIPAGLEERRFCVLDVPPNVMQNSAYFAEMDAELAAGGREALLADLLAVDLDAADAPNPRKIPKTGALLEQKLRSLDSVQSWWYQRLESGAPTRRGSLWRDHVPIDTLFNDYVLTSEKIGVRRKAEITVFSMAMRRLVPLDEARGWPGLSKVKRFEEVEEHDGTTVMRRVNCWRMPPLESCRAMFADAVGQDIAWDDGVNEDG